MLTGDSELKTETAGQSSCPSFVHGLLWWNGGSQQSLLPASSSATESLFVEHPSTRDGARPPGFVQACTTLQVPAQTVAKLQSPPLVMTSVHLSGHGKGAMNELQSPPPVATDLTLSSHVAECSSSDQHELVGPSMAQVSCSCADPCFGGIVALYGCQQVVRPCMPGFQQPCIPLPSEVEEPVYVNAKQFHGIMRRRKIRARAESENKCNKVRKPYLHESRHLHAMRRVRGSGGRFLNTKTGELKGKSDGNCRLPDKGQADSTVDIMDEKLQKGLLVAESQRKVVGQAVDVIEKNSIGNQQGAYSQQVCRAMPSYSVLGGCCGNHGSQARHSSVFHSRSGW